VVARGKEDEKILSELMEKGKTNGVQGLKIIDQTEVGSLMVNDYDCQCRQMDILMCNAHVSRRLQTSSFSLVVLYFFRLLPWGLTISSFFFSST
jgi:hypothetical protein